ncbi:MAG: ATP-binding cassette domain-containing protein [Euryarchaeota archaeon]|jgi:molybdate transport system ATP-binding protein|uniref:ATP-binding cassette domain-containing protein n=1 Tax=Methanobacterium sp. MZD130B TaxID=3394378 RepID=UPI00175F8AD0|nr:ATP-binding cassette domain-containing protein [Euryarchaeota archaeon]HHT18856.1 ATP-binding cassette domain-containing protein [Methanobacterium sp.]
MFLDVQNLSVKLGQFHLNDVNLSLEKNDYLVIIGPTGSGKSVLLETIAGFFTPDKGEIIMEGKKITNQSPENRGISIVYQDYVLFPHMNVFENISYGLQKKINAKKIIQSKVEEIAKLLKIDHLLERNPETLSGGEKQRVAIARSLVVEPKILLMDEPFAALDVNTHAYLTSLIKNVINKHQTTCIHVSHNFNDVYNLAEKVAVMKEGKILQQGTTDEVFTKPSHNFVANFVGVHNVFQGEIVGHDKSLLQIEIDPGIIIHSSDNFQHDSNEVMVAIRPESIIFSNEKFVSSVRNQLKGVVKDMFEVGHTVWIEVQVGDVTFKGVLTPNSCESLGIEREKEVYLSFKSLNVNLIECHDAYHSI